MLGNENLLDENKNLLNQCIQLPITLIFRQLYGCSNLLRRSLCWVFLIVWHTSLIPTFLWICNLISQIRLEGSVLKCSEWLIWWKGALKKMCHFSVFFEHVLNYFFIFNIHIFFNVTNSFFFFKGRKQKIMKQIYNLLNQCILISICLIFC